MTVTPYDLVQVDVRINFTPQAGATSGYALGMSENPYIDSMLEVVVFLMLLFAVSAAAIPIPTLRAKEVVMGRLMSRMPCVLRSAFHLSQVLHEHSLADSAYAYNCSADAPVGLIEMVRVFAMHACHNSDYVSHLCITHHLFFGPILPVVKSKGRFVTLVTLTVLSVIRIIITTQLT